VVNNDYFGFTWRGKPGKFKASSGFSFANPSNCSILSWAKIVSGIDDVHDVAVGYAAPCF